jgi:putative redox protein
MRKVTAISEKEPYAVEIMTEKHHWEADEPRDLGGDDQGPSPYELLLSGVGACAAITARMYAQRKGWPLDSIRVELEHSKIRAEDCADCKTKKGPVSMISIRISVTGDLDDRQRRRIFEIAGKCPVKRTLEGEIKISSELLEEELN